MSPILCRLDPAFRPLVGASKMPVGDADGVTSLFGQVRWNDARPTGPDQDGEVPHCDLLGSPDDRELVGERGHHMVPWVADLANARQLPPTLLEG